MTEAHRTNAQRMDQRFAADADAERSSCECHGTGVRPDGDPCECCAYVAQPAAAEAARRVPGQLPQPYDAERALTKARQIIAENPYAPTPHLVAVAWLQGRIELCEELREPLSWHEFDCFCRRCGKRDGSKMARTPPPLGFFQTVCNDCAAGDAPRAA